MRILEVLQDIESKFVMYHRTPKSRLNNILQNGLLIGSESNLTEAGIWAKSIYGCNPVYLSSNRNTYNFPDSVLLAVDVKDQSLVADLPTLIDRGAYIDETFMYWEGESPIGVDQVEYHRLIDPTDPICVAAIKATRSAASLFSIPPSRLQIINS